MKTVHLCSDSNRVSFWKPLISVITLLIPAYLPAQNLITNGDFSNGTTGWSTGCSIEINPEPVYGGINSSNNVTEIDVERCIDQTICIFPGMTYNFSFKGSRRIGGQTPFVASMNIRITGVTSGSSYINQNRSYSNTTFNLTTSTYSFAVPASSTDRQVQLHFQSLNNSTTYGVLIDDVQLSPQNTLSINGTNSATVNSTYPYAVTNAPASGVLYNWSFDANSTPATSTSATPTTQWTATGTKNVTVALRNSVCTVITLNKLVAVSGVLPLTFTSFTGTLKDNKSVLSFSTSNEENNNYFVVEQSKDGRQYDSVSRIQASNTPGAHTYSFVENNNSSLRYYRIRQVDFDGAFTFSSIVTLKNTGSNKELTLYPSQAGSTIHYSVNIDQPSLAIVQVFDITGKPVINKSAMLMQGTNDQVLNISSLNAGLYFFKLQHAATGVAVVKQFQKLKG